MTLLDGVGCDAGEAAEEVRNVLHSATAAHVLEVDGGHAPPARREAEVRELGIAMNERLMCARAQLAIEGRGRLAQGIVIDCRELVRSRRQVPVRPGLPKTGRHDSEKARVK